MARRHLGVAVLAAVVGAPSVTTAQPSLSQQTPPAPSPAPSPPAVDPPDPPFRHAIGVGVSGTVREKDDLAFILGWEGSYERRINGLFRVGVHGHLSLRNWSVIGDFYARVHEERGKDVVYGYLLGWLAGTGLLAAGPHLVFRAPGDAQPWVSFGSSLLLAIDPREETDKAILGHGAHLAAGYDFGSAGVGVRVHWAPTEAIVFRTNGPSVLAVMATIEWRSGGKATP